jgi:peptidoglycan/LPS O-acetylase OafA/YrhL
VAKFFSLPPITWIGRISYSMYLWHSLAFTFTIIYVFNYTMPFSRAYLEVVDYGMAILFAAVSYYVVEKPFLNLKDRIGNASRPQ